MTKDHDIDAQEPSMEEAGDALKEWLASSDQEDSPAAPADDATDDQEDREDGQQEPQYGPVEPAPQEDAADSPKAAEEPQDAPQEDTAEADNLAQAYAELQAKVAELEAREAARAEAAQKTEALAAAGIKGSYTQLLTGNSDTWAAQIEMLKQFAAENAPAVSIPRDPAVDADLFSDSKDITADEFLRGRRDEF
nr:MAG TPA: hypothetical protein [Bacteriophage sp.]